MAKLFFSFAIFNLLFFILGYSYDYPYSQDSSRDPLSPLISSQGEVLIREDQAVSDLVLQGILYAEEKSSVIINSEVYNKGDLVQGYIIKDIAINQVILEKNNESFTLQWEE